LGIALLLSCPPYYRKAILPQSVYRGTKKNERVKFSSKINKMQPSEGQIEIGGKTVKRKMLYGLTLKNSPLKNSPLDSPLDSSLPLVGNNYPKKRSLGIRFVGGKKLSDKKNKENLVNRPRVS